MSSRISKDLVEIVGLIAIVGSLIFLAMEIRQNTKAQEHAMKMERVSQVRGRWTSDRQPP